MCSHGEHANEIPLESFSVTVTFAILPEVTLPSVTAL